MVLMATGIFTVSPSGVQNPYMHKVNSSMENIQIGGKKTTFMKEKSVTTLLTVPKTPEPRDLIFLNSEGFKTRA